MRRPWIALTLSLAACAANPLHDPGLTPAADVAVAWRTLFVTADSPHRPRTLSEPTVPGCAQPFRVVTEREVGGQRVPAGTVLWGLQREGSWLRQPEFSDALFWRTDFAMVKRVGDERWTRLELASGQEEAMPFRHLVHARSQRFGFAAGRTVGFDADPQAPGLSVVYLLDDDWRVVQALHRVLPATIDAHRGFSVPQPVDVLDTAYVVHHRNEAGALVDVVYDLAGQPLSPELTPLRRMLGEQQASPIRFAIRTDPISDLYWPLEGDGRVAPKPADVLGLKLLLRYDGNAEVLWGAVVVGKSGDDERYAFLPPDNWYGQRATEFVRASNFAAMELASYRSGDSWQDRIGFVVKRVRENDWHVITPGGSGIIGFGSATREAALGLLAGYSRRKAAEYLAEWERKQREYQYAITWRERRAAAEARYEQEVQQALRALTDVHKSAGVEQALAQARTKSALTAADCDAFVRFMLRVCSDSKVTLSLADLEAAQRAAREPSDADRLGTAMRLRYPERFPVVPVAHRGGGGSAASPSSGWGATSTSAPAWSGPSVADTMANMRWQSQMNYLSGQTNFYHGSNGVIRR